jgi:hypothetical protein
MKSAEGDNDTSVLKFVFEIHLIKNFVGERERESDGNVGRCRLQLFCLLG